MIAHIIHLQFNLYLSPYNEDLISFLNLHQLILSEVILTETSTFSLGIGQKIRNQIQIPALPNMCSKTGHELFILAFYVTKETCFLCFSDHNKTPILIVCIVGQN